jgi:putative DNA primase/helicase
VSQPPTIEQETLAAQDPQTIDKAGISLGQFLSAFFHADDEEICLRALKPKNAPDRANNQPLKMLVTQTALTSDPKLREQLRHLNETRGIYFVVNSGGNGDKDIKRFNAVFCENDKLPIPEQHAALDEAPLPPSIRVETSKSVHAYWLLQGECTEAEWRKVQQGLIAHFDSDPAIKNPARVMRLPGFNHVSLNGDGKCHYKPVEIVQFNPIRQYSIQELLGAFPAKHNEQQRSLAPLYQGCKGW